jgi:outer-membrane receptor for ferric coprogen and ferric-rhodotorulic acid
MIDRTARRAAFAKRRLAGFTALSTLAFSLAGMTTAPALAQQDARARTYDFNLPAQSLGQSITQAAAVGNLQVLYGDDDTSRLGVPALKGRMTVDQALERLLAGSGYTYRYERPGVITLIKVPRVSETGERVLGSVRVEGAQGGGLFGSTSVNGINGSRDVTATEGTGSYTTGAMTIGSKTAESIKDVPASVSVLTSAQIQDQNITGIKSAMEKLPGVIAVTNGDTAHPTFYSRGFQITTFQIDGGAGLRTTGGTGNGNFFDPAGGTYVPQMDMSLYDHVEIIRGAAGTFNGFGDPGGVINLVRKRPLDHAQLMLEGQLGSYELRRVSVDLTGPIAFEGKLRGRLIATHQDNNFFYDVVHQDKNLISATVEFDASSTTLASVGGSYDSQNGGLWRAGLMRYTDGRPLPVPRSICLCLPWGFFDTKTIEGFAQIEQKIGPRWNLKYKVTYQKQIQDGNSPYIDGNVSPYGTAVRPTLVSGDAFHAQPRRWLQELTIDGSFRLFGQMQKIVAGGNLAFIDGKGAKTYYLNAFPNGEDRYVIDPLAYNPYDPRWADPGKNFVATENVYNSERNVGAFIRADISPLPRLHVLTAVNFSTSSVKWKSNFKCIPRFIPDNIFGCTTVGTPLPDNTLSSNFTVSGSRNVSWPPSTSLRYDFSDSLSIYGTYADIYLDQSATLARDLKPLNPVTGANFEGGVKWAPDSGRFNVNLSGYYTRQRNFATLDCHDPSAPEDGTPECSNGDFGAGDTLASLASCCWKNNPDLEKLSFGGDLDISGQIRSNWQVSASYNFNKNVLRGPTQFDRFTGERNPLLSFSPRHLYKIWTSYSFPENSNLRGLDLNFGAQGQSVTFVYQTYCPQPYTDGRAGCPVRFQPVHFTDPGHVVFSMGGSYKVTPQLTLQANVENLLDKTYFAQVGYTNGQNWYGVPRNFTVTLRGKW